MEQSARINVAAMRNADLTFTDAAFEQSFSCGVMFADFLKSGDLDRVGDDFCEYDKLAIVRELINSAELNELL